MDKWRSRALTVQLAGDAQLLLVAKHTGTRERWLTAMIAALR